MQCWCDGLKAGSNAQQPRERSADAEEPMIGSHLRACRRRLASVLQSPASSSLLYALLDSTPLSSSSISACGGSPLAFGTRDRSSLPGTAWKQPQLFTLFDKLFSFDKPLSRHHVNQKATQAACLLGEVELLDREIHSEIHKYS